MIPTKLELYNFMPYHDPPPLDLSGIHVACLSGDNGAGKSALLDAITWSLWGRARSRRDDELIYQGETEMSVQFTFELDNNVYRVIRARRAGTRSQGALDLQVLSPEGDFRTMAEATMRETQAKIIHLLRLDYDTFVNSAFLLQNRADEFTLKTPAQRKQVLADILGLSKWEGYEARAKERLKELQEQIRLVDNRLEEIDTEVARRPDYKSELLQAQQLALETADALHQAESVMHELQQATLDLRNTETQIADLEGRLTQTQAELDRLGLSRSTAQARLDEFQRALDEREQIEAGFAALEAARAANEALGAKLGQLVQLNEQKNRLESAIADARRALETETQLAAQAVAELETRVADLALEVALDQLQAQVQAAQARAGEAEAGRGQLAALVHEVAERRAQNAALKRDMDALKARMEAVKALGAICPTCGRPLGDDERTRLLDEWQAEGETMGDTWRANKAAVEERLGRQAELEGAVAAAEADAKGLPALHKQVAELETRYQAAIDAAAMVELKQTALAELRQRQAGQDYAHAAQAELSAVLGELAALGYAASEHQRVRDELAQLAGFEEQRARLEHAEAGIAEEQKRLAELGEAEARWQATLAADQARCAELEARAEAARAQLAGAESVRQQLDEARLQERVARERVGAAQQKLATCDALSKQKKTRLAEREQLAHQQGLYEELRLALGKKGVPALIIEAAIPEIEDEANALLARITGGRMHVRFDMQRETLKGDTVETFEINIADELGTRPYENYSGGEQFRINFAIRIAISKLLARRAGAQLQTLVIDEGFGALDTSGRERLVEAIHTVQDDFSRILVITHIDELRDLFPARIEVTKTPGGSQISLA
jgi:exonuclease SbcC